MALHPEKKYLYAAYREGKMKMIPQVRNCGLCTLMKKDRETQPPDQTQGVSFRGCQPPATFSVGIPPGRSFLFPTTEVPTWVLPSKILESGGISGGRYLLFQHGKGKCSVHCQPKRTAAIAHRLKFLSTNGWKLGNASDLGIDQILKNRVKIPKRRQREKRTPLKIFPVKAGSGPRHFGYNPSCPSLCLILWKKLRQIQWAVFTIEPKNGDLLLLGRCRNALTERSDQNTMQLQIYHAISGWQSGLLCQNRGQDKPWPSTRVDQETGPAYPSGDMVPTGGQHPRNFKV